MHDIILPEWRNSNEHRKYPFSDLATLVNAAGRRIDQDLFLDARLYPLSGAADLYLSRIDVSATAVTITIGTTDDPALASGSFPANAPPDNIDLVDVYGRPAGILVSTTAKLNTMPGLYGPGGVSWEPDETPFATSVIVPMPQKGVLGFLLDDGTVLAGDVYLVGTDGIVLSMEDGDIRIDAIGNPYAKVEACADGGTPLPKFCGIRTINGIRPGDNGDFRLFNGSGIVLDGLFRVVAQGPGRMQILRVGQIGAIDA